MNKQISISFLQMNFYKAVILFFLLSNCNSRMPLLIEDKKLEGSVKCSLEFDQANYFVGDQIRGYFVVTNNTAQRIYIERAPQGMYVKGQKIGGMEITVETESGELLEKMDALNVISDWIGITPIDPMEKLQIPIKALFEYGITKKEGNYKITIKKEFSVYLNKRKREKGKGQLQNYKKYIEKVKTLEMWVEIKDGE